MTMFIAVGLVLGVLSRIEETTPGFSIGVSSDATWLGLAFLVGVMQHRSGFGRAAVAGALTLTVANASYYAWIATTEPGVALASVAGPPEYWFLLGVLGGAMLAVTGSAWSLSNGAMRVAWSLPLAGVWIADGIDHPERFSGAVIGALGFALPILSARRARERLVAGVLSVGVVALSLTGRLDPFLP